MTEARRLQENGAITRARKLYETALAMRPDGVEALAGMGYVQLDRNKFSSAISYFRRALSIGQHPPALFGMGEAYRYAGDPKSAPRAPTVASSPSLPTTATPPLPAGRIRRCPARPRRVPPGP